MTDNIKLPPYPEGLCLREDIEDYAREAVRLNAQAVPEISTEHGPWIESNIHEGETYCKRCLVRSVFAGKRECDPHIVSAAPAAPQPAQPPIKAELLCVCGCEWHWESRSWELVSGPYPKPAQPLTAPQKD